MTVSESVSD